MRDDQTELHTFPVDAEPPQPQFDIDPPPDGGYGWVQVGAAFLINCFTWGQTASYSIYLAHYLSSNQFPTATPIDYALIGSLQFAVSLLIAPLVTVAARKFSTQPPMLLGILLQTIGFITASYASKIWHLYLSQGLLIGLGLGFIFVPSTPILSQWFSKKRSLAIGISSAGSGVGGLLFSFGIQAMIDNLSLSWAFRITAIICGIMNLLAVALIKNRNAAIKPPMIGFDRKLLVRYDVGLMLAWGFLSMLGYMVLLYSLPSFSESIGLDKNQAAAISAYLNLGIAIGRPMIGLTSDRLGRIEVSGFMTFFCGLICFAIWIPARVYGVTIFFAIVSGAVVGVFWMTVAPIAVEVAGLNQVPSLLSLMWLTIFLPILLIALKLRREGASNEYLYPQIFAGLSMILASLCLLELWRHKHGTTLFRDGLLNWRRTAQV
ncbi:related to protein MCH2 (monocarboxylate permease homolog) [Phialocephala subalpina]|uniref:Related to protein MCH2 (Monocarboxylate permease homolog) n=1 Tax=Phialocephala subalpina TaxID=576137 RepID=A0A1L7X4N5_9HELO|nr:related to protein MCH2 (monocarboxylate permease homolog) [Phialocephala subalpina]